MGIVLKRKELHERVWREPMGQISRALDVTSAKLRECCRKMSIPLPPTSYWIALKAGESLAIPDLEPYNGPDRMSIGPVAKQSLVDWILEGRALNTLSPPTKKRYAASGPQLSTRQPGMSRYVTVIEWAEARFSQPPHRNTLQLWIREGRIQPQPKKIGRKWWIERNAEYRPD